MISYICSSIILMHHAAMLEAVLYTLFLFFFATTYIHKRNAALF